MNNRYMNPNTESLYTLIKSAAKPVRDYKKLKHHNLQSLTGLAADLIRV